MTATRRDFIKQLGYISVGFSMVGTVGLANGGFLASDKIDLLKGLPEKNQINAWLQILENGKIRVLSGKIELGQGIRIAIAQMAAEELNTDLDLIEVNIAETGVTPNEGFTAGSSSIVSSAMSVRKAAAAAREIILKMASEKWGIGISKLQLRDGQVIGPKQEIALYALFEGKQIEETIASVTEYKGKTIRKYVGQPIPRKDIDAMVRGQEVFVQDLRFPNMVHARVVRPPSYTARLTSFNEAEFRKSPNLLKLIRKGSFLGVLAKDEYQAIQLMEKAKRLAKWNAPESLPDNINLKEYLKMLPADVEIHEKKGDSETSLKQSKNRLSASFFKPYLMHAANGPSCAVALFKEGELYVWTHSQGVYPLRRTLAKLLKMAEETVHLKAVPGSGCFGQNGANDAATEAALIALEYPGKHVRLQWTREDENGWEPYGTAMIVELQAGLDERGKIEGWNCDIWSDGHSNRPNGNPNTLLPAQFLEEGYGHPGIGYRGGAVRNAIPYYDIPDLKVETHIFQGPLRASSLRGLGTYTNVFAIESFMDELARMSNSDPIEFRIRHSTDERSVVCMRKLEQKLIGISLKDGEGLGHAFSRYKNNAAYCAMAAHVHVNEITGNVQVKKMWAVVDAGETINPDGLKNQMEGGMIQSASWALKEEVRFDALHVTSLDWNSYPIFRFPDVPEVEVEVIDRIDQPPMGAGEAAQAPATAAIVNAIFDAVGVRIRELPVSKELIKQAKISIH
ncbi:molybdopterin cofactor-binding domain-containing protein [uncultured Kriegella sp.]|uniref:xanthine dehydrogenase family protein molybdopterin-binding subunit n=1 Tax=uncultured Kriegella sp. TaxID=1798910 RepID=UPI0030DA78F8|tara:strand:- start:45193 stop:47403 length:2211 start_codon:yes stop_codon:yes gene_type:complete